MSISTSKSTVYKKTILRFGIGFLVVIVLLTFFSGTLNNIALAKVSVVSPSSSSLQKIITANGTFAAKEIVNVNLDVAGKVLEVLVQDGDIVKAGDPLLKMDMTDLQSQIASEKVNLTKMLNNKAKSQLTVAPNYTSQNVQISKAKQTWQKAKTDYAALVATGTATADQLAAAKQNITDTYNSYKVAVAQLSTTKKQDANQKKSSAIDLKNTDLDIKTEQNKIATLEKQLKDNSVIEAKIAGRIQTVGVKVGDQAGTTQPVMTMLNTAKGLEFTVDVSNDNADLMAEGSQLDIHLDGTTTSINGTLREKENSTAQPGEMMTIYYDADTQGVLDNNVQPNQKGDIRYTSSTDSYNMTLINGAVREDSTGYFVLVVQQSTTPLGKSLVLKRVDVTVDDSDSYRSAVSGSLSQRDQVVSNSDKSVADGDVVRLAS
jgi:HlyD family secretion protein